MGGKRLIKIIDCYSVNWNSPTLCANGLVGYLESFLLYTYYHSGKRFITLSICVLMESHIAAVLQKEVEYHHVGINLHLCYNPRRAGGKSSSKYFSTQSGVHPTFSLFFPLPFLLSHNTKTTSWLDPRLAKKAKPPEECEDDGKCTRVCLCVCVLCVRIRIVNACNSKKWNCA